jgi:hypothetical protein
VLAGHEEHVCSSVLEKNQRAMASALAGVGAVEEVVDGGEDGILLGAGQALDAPFSFADCKFQLPIEPRKSSGIVRLKRFQLRGSKLGEAL